MHYEAHRNLVPLDTLFMHGNVASNLWWDPALLCWERRRDRRVEFSDAQPHGGALIFAEWRGCGKSSGPSSEAELEFSVLARDYIELLDSLGVQKANLVAHSTGALIALHAMKLEPGLFHRVVLLDPPPARGVEVSQEARMAFIELSRSRDALKEVIGQAVGRSDDEPSFFETLVDHALGAHPVIWAGILKVIGRVDLVADLPRIAQPTLVLHGERDPVLPISGAMEIGGLLPEGRFQLLNGQGHSCQIENPERFVDLADHFLFG